MKKVAQNGFVGLALTVIVALVLVAAVGAITIVVLSSSVTTADVSAERDEGVAEAGLADAVERLRWGWLRPAEGETVQASVSGWPTSAYALEVRGLRATELASLLVARGWHPYVPMEAVRGYEISVTATGGAGRRRLAATVVAQPDALGRGLQARRDVRVSGPLTLCGCGLYAGGDVSGREAVTLTSPPASPAWPDVAPVLPDLACGGLWPQAGVHARGSIFVEGREEHGSGDAIAGDSDEHDGVVPPLELVAGPGAAALAGVRSHAVVCELGPDDTFDLGVLPASAPHRGAREPTPWGGLIIVVQRAAEDGPIVVGGSRPDPPIACPVTVVVCGDCLLGAVGGSVASEVSFAGALVVTGTLTVAGPARVAGSVAARRVTVEAPFTILATEVSSCAGQDYAPGASNFHIATWTE